MCGVRPSGGRHRGRTNAGVRSPASLATSWALLRAALALGVLLFLAVPVRGAVSAAGESLVSGHEVTRGADRSYELSQHLQGRHHRHSRWRHGRHRRKHRHSAGGSRSFALMPDRGSLALPSVAARAAEAMRQVAAVDRAIERVATGVAAFASPGWDSMASATDSSQYHRNFTSLLSLSDAHFRPVVIHKKLRHSVVLAQGAMSSERLQVPGQGTWGKARLARSNSSATSRLIETHAVGLTRRPTGRKAKPAVAALVHDREVHHQKASQVKEWPEGATPHSNTATSSQGAEAPSPAEEKDAEKNVTYAHNLIAQMLEGYKQDEPPMRYVDDHVDVALALKLTKLLAINQVERTITVASWIRQFWYDPRLDFDGSALASHWKERQDFLQIDTGKIWVPDTTLINSVDFNWGEACDTSVKAFVYSSGSRFVSASGKLDLTKDEKQANEYPLPFNVMLLRPCVLKAKCDVDLSYYPFDQFICPFIFQPWGDKFINLHIAADAITSLVNLPEFAVRMYNASTSVSYYRTAAADWPQLTVNVEVARHGHYYVVNVICPILLIVLLTWFAFWVPMKETDRVSYMMTLVLTVMAIMAINAEKRPATDGNMWLDEFQMITMLLVVLSALYTIWVLRIRPPDAPNQEWSAEAIRQRLVLIEYVERIARIVFPILVVLSLGYEFLLLELYEQKGPRSEKNFSGKATIWVFVFIFFVFLLKMADIIYTWFPEFMPDAGMQVRQLERAVTTAEARKEQKRKDSIGGSRSSEDPGYGFQGPLGPRADFAAPAYRSDAGSYPSGGYYSSGTATFSRPSGTPPAGGQGAYGDLPPGAAASAGGYTSFNPSGTIGPTGGRVY